MLKVKKDGETPVNPNVPYLRQGKTRKSAADVVAHRLGQDKAYLSIREVLFLAQPQMACYRASAAIITGVGMQR